MRIISAQEINETLDFAGIIEALRQAFQGGVTTPPRHHHNVEHNGTLLLMPAFNEKYLGTKIVSVFPQNSAKHLPAVQGQYFLQNGETGEAIALLEGKTLTAWRTAAASALASQYLSRKNSETLLMVGAGALAPHLIAAHCAVRPIKRVILWNKRCESSQLLAKQGYEIFDNLKDAVGEADIISCATLSKEPLIKGEWLKNGTHLDLVGGFTPQMRETDDATILKASIFLDTLAGGLKEAGDITDPIARGIIKAHDIKGDLFSLSQGRHKGRVSQDEITLFKSVGTALEDLAAAILVVEKLHQK